VNRAAGVALAVHTILRAGQQALDLVELGVGLLQLGGAAGEHVEAIVVTDRHFVGEPAEIPGQRGDALGQLVAAAAQLGDGWRPPVTSVWLITLAGGTFAQALAQPAAAPYIDSQLVKAGTLLSGWSSLAGSAFASEAGLLGGTPVTGVEASPVVNNIPSGTPVNDTFSCSSEIPGYAEDCVGATTSQYAQYETIAGQFAIGTKLCAEPRVDALLTVTYAYLEKGVVTQAISGPFDLGRPASCPPDAQSGWTRLNPKPVALASTGTHRGKHKGKHGAAGKGRKGAGKGKKSSDKGASKEK
jgi:hypothetical protein